MRIKNRKWVVGFGFLSLAIGLWCLWLHFGHSFTYNGGLNQNGKVGLETEEKELGDAKKSDNDKKETNPEDTCHQKKERIIN